MMVSQYSINASNVRVLTLNTYMHSYFSLPHNICKTFCVRIKGKSNVTDAMLHSFMTCGMQSYVVGALVVHITSFAFQLPFKCTLWTTIILRYMYESQVFLIVCLNLTLLYSYVGHNNNFIGK